MKVTRTFCLDSDLMQRLLKTSDPNRAIERALSIYFSNKETDKFDAWWNGLAGAEKERLLGAAEKACVLNSVSDKQTFLWAWWLDGSWKEKVLGK